MGINFATSDSTNLAAGSAQTGLFDHVAAMVTTTLPSLIIATIIFAFFSFSKVETYDPTLANELSDAIIDTLCIYESNSSYSYFTDYSSSCNKDVAIQPVVLLSLIGCAFALIFQGAGIADCIKMLHYGYEAESEMHYSQSL